jgi:hypothetical protein
MRGGSTRKWSREWRKRVGVAQKVAAGLAGLILGVALVFFLNDLSAIDQTYVKHAAKQSDDARTAAQRYIGERCLRLPPSQAEQCTYEAHNTAAQQAHEQRDLAAQRQSALWTKWMGLAAIVGVLASLVGVALVWFTFRETRKGTRVAQREYGRARIEARKAAKEAQKSLAANRRMAAAAAKQVTIAQSTAYRDLRAYISVEIKIESVSKVLIYATLGVTNAGKTPARIEVYFNAWIGGFPLKELPPESPAPFRHYQHDPFVNANSGVEVELFYPWGRVATANELDELSDDTKSFYLYGRVEYVDFARHRRVLHFAYRKHGLLEYGKPFNMIPCPWGNEYEDRGVEA